MARLSLGACCSTSACRSLQAPAFASYPKCPCSRPSRLGPVRRVALASGEGSSSIPGAGVQTFDYNSEDGVRQKATIEHYFDVQQDDSAAEEPREESPWSMGWQISERNFSFEGLKPRLIKRVASEHLGISEEEMTWRLTQLMTVLPGLESRLAAAPPKLVARLAAHTSDVADRIIRLKSLFPAADVCTMVNNRLTLLLDDDMEAVQEAGDKLRVFLPNMDVDKFVEAFPLVLDYDSFEMAMEDASRIMPGQDMQALLRSNPDIITSLVKGKNLIPYDEISNPWS